MFMFGPSGPSSFLEDEEDERFFFFFFFFFFQSWREGATASGIFTNRSTKVVYSVIVGLNIFISKFYTETIQKHAINDRIRTKA